MGPPGPALSVTREARARPSWLCVWSAATSRSCVIGTRPARLGRGGSRPSRRVAKPTKCCVALVEAVGPTPRWSRMTSGPCCRVKARLVGEIDVAGPDLAAKPDRPRSVDEYRTLFPPLRLGHGKPFFAAPGRRSASWPSDLVGEGVIRLTYFPLNRATYRSALGSTREQRTDPAISGQFRRTVSESAPRSGRLRAAGKLSMETATRSKEWRQRNWIFHLRLRHDSADLSVITQQLGFASELAGIKETRNSP